MDVIVDKSPVDNMILCDPDQSMANKNGQKDGDNTPTVNMMSDLQLWNGGELTINEGTLAVNGNSLFGDGNFEVNTGGTLSLTSNSTLKMGDGSELKVYGGLLETIGTPGNMAHITHYSGFYDIDINFGGTISAEYTIFEYINHPGADNATGIVDTTHSFHYCTFLNGSDIGSLLSISNDQILTFNYVNFPQMGVSENNIHRPLLGLGEINMVNATGCFQGEDFEYDPSNKINWTYTNSRNLDITVLLEGPFNNSTNEMNTDINSILPLNQPFDYTPLGNYYTPQWLFPGSQSVVAIPNPEIVDWILVELRNAWDVNSAEYSTAIFTHAAFLTKTGQIVDLDGVSPLTFTYSPAFSLYAVVWHRNHLGVISANPLVEDNGTFVYDFSSSADQAYGGTDAQKMLSASPEKWGMVSGDANGDSYIDIDNSDKILVWNILVGENGYLEADFDLDGEVDNQDKNEYWLPNLGTGTFVPY
ncbi:MAG: hypothetical protein R2750_10490 [Bacteroidales bacterium]